jgi:hypothetical protein
MDLQRLIFAVWDELRKASEEHSCIMAAAVLLDVLRAKGIRDAYPLTVKPRIFNPAATERLGREPMPQTPGQIAEWEAAGCFMVAIGYGEGSASEWPAHLVVVIPKALKGRDAVCDLTITQANVPAQNIRLGQIMVGVREEFVSGTEDFGVTINGCRVVYRAFPEDESFKQTPVWKKKLAREMIARRVLKRL